MGASGLTAATALFYKQRFGIGSPQFLQCVQSSRLLTKEAREVLAQEPLKSTTLSTTLGHLVVGDIAAAVVATGNRIVGAVLSTLVGHS